MPSVASADLSRQQNQQQQLSPNAAQDVVLPPLNALPSLSISPPNSSLRLSPSHAGFGAHAIPPLLPRSCRLLGCANFAKIHGYCAAHFHGDAEPVATRLPPLRLDHAPSGERPMIPTVYYAPQQNPIFTQRQQLPSLSLRRFSEPVAPQLLPIPVAIPMRSQMPRRQSVDSLAGYRRSGLTPKSGDALKPSPTHSAGSATSPKALCRRENCVNAARRKGLCMEHGGRHFCKMEGCHKCAHRGGYCIAHGGGRRCAVDKCTKSAQSGGVCYSHGGGKRCATDGCSHAARSGGFCIKHGKMLKQKESGAEDEQDDEDISE